MATGAMGMSRDDFMRCTPDEFTAIHKAWHERIEAESHERWELMRMHACITIQPHVKKRMSPRTLLPLPWEQGHRVETCHDRTKEPGAEHLSKEELRARFNKRLEQLNN